MGPTTIHFSHRQCLRPNLQGCLSDVMWALFPRGRPCRRRSHQRRCRTALPPQRLRRIQNCSIRRKLASAFMLRHHMCPGICFGHPTLACRQSPLEHHIWSLSWALPAQCFDQGGMSLAMLCRGDLRGDLSRRVLSNHPLDTLLVFHFVPLEQVVCLGLRWRLGIGVVQEILDTEDDLFDGDGRFPAFILVEYRQANGPRRVDVWVE